MRSSNECVCLCTVSMSFEFVIEIRIDWNSTRQLILELFDTDTKLVVSKLFVYPFIIWLLGKQLPEMQHEVHQAVLKGVCTYLSSISPEFARRCIYLLGEYWIWHFVKMMKYSWQYYLKYHYEEHGNMILVLTFYQSYQQLHYFRYMHNCTDNSHGALITCWYLYGNVRCIGSHLLLKCIQIAKDRRHIDIDIENLVENIKEKHIHTLALSLCPRNACNSEFNISKQITFCSKNRSIFFSSIYRCEWKITDIKWETSIIKNANE